MTIAHIQKILDDEKLDSTLLPATDKAPFERLIVYLGKDAKEREKILEIEALSLQLEGPFVKAVENALFKIQFNITFPFKVEDLSSTQTGSLILYLNHLIDWPGFELDELNNRVSYRYVWMATQRAIEATTLLNVIGIIGLLHDMFSETIEQVATGKQSFNDILEQVVSLSKFKVS